MSTLVRTTLVASLDLKRIAILSLRLFATERTNSVTVEIRLGAPRVASSLAKRCIMLNSDSLSTQEMAASRLASTFPSSSADSGGSSVCNPSWSAVRARSFIGFARQPRNCSGNKMMIVSHWANASYGSHLKA
jgi:hypothetical protein